jgi:hypothetical protein
MAFAGNQRWLEIRVKLPAAGAYTLLTPRQELTPSPNAVFSATTGSVAWANVTSKPAGFADDIDDGIAAEVDGIIGNEITGATNTSLTRSGAGTAASPYTLSVDTTVIQSRVGSTCAANSSMRVINQDGTVVCEADDSYTNAQAVAAVAAQTVTRSITYGPTDFVMAKQDGTPIVCSLPSTNCSFPSGATTNLYLTLKIPVPSTITGFACRVLDNDTSPTGNITINAFNSNNLIGSAATSGAPGLGQLAVTLNSTLGTDARGPTVQIQAVHSAGQPTSFIYWCWATYTTSAL